MRSFFSLALAALLATSARAEVAAIRLGEARSTADGFGAELEDELRFLHHGDPALLHAVPRADSLGYRTIIGKFTSLRSQNLGVDPADAALAFLQERPAAWP